MLVERQYIGRDNIIDFLLKADGAAQDLSSVTKIDLVVGDTTISNEVASNFPIKWSTGMTGKIQLRLGDQLIPEGRHSARLVVYDTTYPDGLVWGTFTLIMYG